MIVAGGILIDGTGRDPVDGGVIEFDGPQITRVGGRVGTEGVVDAGGLTVLPGLIDAHTHLGMAYDLAQHAHEGMVPVAEIAARVFENCELALDNGFTTCRELGGLDGGIVRAIDKGLVRGPRILPSGTALAQDGGHGTFMAPWSDCYCPVAIPGLTHSVAVCDGVDEVRKAARRAFRRGAVQLKVFVSGGVVSLTDEISHSQFSVDELRAAVEEAHARGTYVTAHGHSLAGIRNGLAAGVECFEHGSWLDEEVAALMAAAGAALVPTLAVVRVMRTEWQAWGLPEAVLPRLDQVGNDMINAVRVARAAGVLLGSGADLLGPEQRRHGLELVLRAEIEDPMTAITTATRDNAKILRRSDLGTIEVGKTADMIAVDGDPLADPGLFDEPDRIVLVIRDGVVVKDER